MDARPFHEMLLEKRGMLDKSEIDAKKHPYNSFVFQDPTLILNCTPDGGYENFQHIVGGDCLVYGEIMNSTPIQKHHTVLDEHVPLVRKCYNTGNVFSKTGINTAYRKIIGIPIYMWDFLMSKHREVGKVVDSAIFRDTYCDEVYFTCCILCWISQHDVDAVKNRLDLLTICPIFDISRRVCCYCGTTYYSGASHEYIGSMCRHMSPFNDDSLNVVSVDYVCNLVISKRI